MKGVEMFQKAKNIGRSLRKLQGRLRTQGDFIFSNQTIIGKSLTKT
jgi:hypothetical protein